MSEGVHFDGIEKRESAIIALMRFDHEQQAWNLDSLKERSRNLRKYTGKSCPETERAIYHLEQAMRKQ